MNNSKTNVRVPKPRNVLTPKPTPTPRRPLPKIPATPLSGIANLPATEKFDRVLHKSERQFDRIKQQYEKLKNPYKDPENTKKKSALQGSRIKREWPTQKEKEGDVGQSRQTWVEERTRRRRKAVA